LAGFQFRKVQASRSWPYTPGRILQAKIDTTTSRGNPDEADSTSFSPEIQYEYYVDNQRYLGNRIGFAEGAIAAQAAERALKAFQVGALGVGIYDFRQGGAGGLEKKAPGGHSMDGLGAVMCCWHRGRVQMTTQFQRQVKLVEQVMAFCVKCGKENGARHEVLHRLRSTPWGPGSQQLANPMSTGA